MKRVFPFAILVLSSLLLLSLGGCDSDEEITSADGPCGITITQPVPGKVFLSNDLVSVLWKRSGTATNVRIELLKSGEAVGDISSIEENDGYFFWYADNMGQPNGNDFSIRVSAVDEASCFDISPEFSLTNISGCNFEFITPPAWDPDRPLVLNASEGEVPGDTYEITWFSQYTTGLVDLQLLHYADIIGYIATDVPDSNQSYDWAVDSLHFGSGSNFKVQVIDTKVPSCKSLSPIFDIVDNDICEILSVTPETPGLVLKIGDTYTIQWVASRVEGNLDILLYYKNERIDVIDVDVDPDLGSYDWSVWIPTVPELNTAQYQIKLVDNANSIAPCEGRSAAFLVTD